LKRLLREWQISLTKRVEESGKGVALGHCQRCGIGRETVETGLCGCILKLQLVRISNPQT
jgi:hypothetical protein